VSNKLIIRGDNISGVQLIDSKGLYEQNIQFTQGAIDTSQWSPGLYLLVIYSADGVKRLKVVKD